MNLKNEYHIIDFTGAGFPCVEVRGKNFCYEDLYELSGQHGYMTTFGLKADTHSYAEFGESLTGVILYTPDETKELAAADKLKIRCFDRDGLKPEIIEELKYGGLSISDIEFVSFLPLN